MSKKNCTPHRIIRRQLWTLVQHSAYAGAKKDEDFFGGLEEASVDDGTALARRIVAAGGVLYDEYGYASKVGLDYMYPSHVNNKPYRGLRPLAHKYGVFNDKLKIDGRSLFVPTPKI